MLPITFPMPDATESITLPIDSDKNFKNQRIVPYKRTDLLPIPETSTHETKGLYFNVLLKV